MKKAIVLLLLLLLALSLFAGCGKKQTSADAAPSPTESPSDSLDPSDPTATPTPSPAPDFPSDAKVTATKEGDTVKIQISAAALAGKQLSLVIVKDASYQYNWAEDTEGRLCDLGQICLDSKGEGSATLQLNGGGDTARLVLTAEDGTSTILSIN